MKRLLHIATQWPRWTIFLTVTAVLLLFNIPAMFRESGLHTHLHLANAFLHGRLYIQQSMDDVIAWQGRYYVPFPPFPAILLMPFVAIWGLGFKTMLLTPFLGGGTAVLLFSTLRRLKVSEEVCLWAAVGFVFGTAYWLCVRIPYDAYFAHVVAVLFCTLALREALEGKRGPWIGLYLGAACLSRHFSAFTIPIAWGLLLWHDREARPLSRRWIAIGLTCVGLALCLGGLLYYNRARFGAPLEDGYRFLEEETWYGYRMARWGNFNWIYLPSNLLRMFVLGFCIQFEPPAYLFPTMSPWGTSLTFASPFLFYAFRGRPDRSVLLNALGWLCIAGCLLGILLHKSAGGGWQINGMRYALDFMPLLMLYAAAGMERYREPPWKKLWQAAIVYSVALNVLAQAIHYAGKLVLLIAGSGLTE